MSGPLVSIVMGVYNAQAYLAQAIESVRAQSLADWEFIAINDGSADGSEQILRQLAMQEPRLRIISRENRGHAASLAEGVRAARGTFIARMDADDLCLPDRFERQVAFLQAHPEVAMVGGAVEEFSGEGQVRGVRRFPLDSAGCREVLAVGAPFCHPAVMMRREALLAVGNYRPQFRCAEDYDLWTRLAERYELANLPEVVLRYRTHAGQISTARVQQQAWETVAVQHVRRLRQAGQADWINALQAIDAEELIARGVSADELEMKYLYMLRGQALLCEADGRPADAARLAQALGRAPQVGRLSRRSRAMRWWVLGKTLLIADRHGLALLAVARSLVTDPTLALGAAWRTVQR